MNEFLLSLESDNENTVLVDALNSSKNSEKNIPISKIPFENQINQPIILPLFNSNARTSLISTPNTPSR